MPDLPPIQAWSKKDLLQALDEKEIRFSSLQDQLRQKQKKFKETFDNAAIGLAHVALDGRWIRVNHALCDILGYDEQKILSMNFQDITHPDDLQADIEQLRILLRGDIPRYALEKRYIQRDGSAVWVKLNVALVRTDEGSPDYFVSVIENINGRKQAESALFQTQRRHEIVINAARLGAFDFFGENDPRNYWSYWIRQHFGLDEHTPLSFSRFVRLIHPEDWPGLEKELNLCMSVPESRYHVEYRVLGEQDHELRWIEASGQSFFDEQENSIRLCGTTVDVTARKTAELAVQTSEARLRLALENIPDVVVIFDQELRIRYINGTSTLMPGLRPKDFIGKAESDIFPSQLSTAWRPGLQAALSEGRTSSFDLTIALTSGQRHCHLTCVPLRNESGDVIEIMGIIHDFTERKIAQEQALRAALHDPLTGLPNRVLLFEYSSHIFDHAARNGHAGAVLFIDLDRFKQVNDLHGHGSGDRLLMQVVERIRACLRSGDLVFHMGGDEFLVLLPEIAHDSESAQVAERLVAIIAEPYQLGEVSMVISASIGISLFPADGQDINQLVQAGDSAMYLAKQSGKNTWRFFSHALSKAVRETIELQNRIRGALERDEFELHFQPLLDLATNQICSVEALLRWKGSTIGPDKFIPAAEAVGQIIPIGHWVIEQACRTLRHWLDQGMSMVPVAINVSALQFRQKDFRRKLLQQLQEFNLPPSALQLELTESAMLEDLPHAIELLRQFRSDSIKISLDDFGTGYSSLSHIARLPIDKIKIDKSFVQSIDTTDASRAVTEAIVAIARRLKLEIVAEGIETLETLEELKSLGCGQVQGYLVSRPLPADVFLQAMQHDMGRFLPGGMTGAQDQAVRH